MPFSRNTRFVAVLVVALATPVLATIARSAPVPAAERADIRTLMKVSGVEGIALQMGGYVANAMIDMEHREHPTLDERSVAAIKDEVAKVTQEHMPSLLEQIMPAYANHFTWAEIRQLVAFYRSPLGSKVVSEMGSLTRETSAIGQSWAKGLGPELERRVDARLRALGVSGNLGVPHR